MPDFSMEALFQLLSRNPCDELYVTADDPIAVQLHGQIVRLETRRLTPEDTIRLMKSITPEKTRRQLDIDGSVEFGCVSGDEYRFHVSVFKAAAGVRMVLRPMTDDPDNQ